MSDLETIQRNDLPSGWRVVELNNITKLSNVKFDLKDLILDKYISTNNMLKNLGGIECAKKIPLTGKVKAFQKGDVLFSNIRTYFRKVWYATSKGGCSNDVLVFSSIKGTHSKYMYYLLADNRFIDYTAKTSKGTKMPRGDKEAILKYFVHIPPLTEQKAIANILGKLDDKIELNRQINQTLETTAQTLFKSWFVDFDPVIDNALKAGNPIPDSLKPQANKRKAIKSTLPQATQSLFPNRFVFNDILKKWIPEGWTVKKLGEVSMCFDSKRIPLSKKQREYKKPSIYPYYGATSINDHINDYIFNNTYLLLGEDGSVIKKNNTPFTQYVWGKIWVNNHAHVLQGNNGVSTEHLLVFMKQQNVSPYITGAVQLKINQGNMNKIPFLFSSDEINDKFSKKINSLYKKFKSNFEEIQTLTRLRDTLLPKLISGKIRVIVKN